MFPFKGVISLVFAGWMLVTGHYPFNLDIALSGLRTRGRAFEPNGFFVRLSGGLVLFGFFLGFLLPEIGEELQFVVYVAAGIALVISFFGSFKSGFKI